MTPAERFAAAATEAPEAEIHRKEFQSPSRCCYLCAPSMMLVSLFLDIPQIWMHYSQIRIDTTILETKSEGQNFSELHGGLFPDQSGRQRAPGPMIQDVGSLHISVLEG